MPQTVLLARSAANYYLKRMIEKDFSRRQQLPLSQVIPQVGTQPALQPLPEERIDLNPLDAGIGNSAIANSVSKNSLPSLSNVSNLQSTFGNAAVAQNALAQVNGKESQVNVAPEPPANESVVTEETTPAQKSTGKEAKSITQTATNEAGTKAEKALATTEEVVATTEEEIDLQPLSGPVTEAEPMPSLFEFLGPVQQGGGEEVEESEPVTSLPEMESEEQTSFSATPALNSEPELTSPETSASETTESEVATGTGESVQESSTQASAATDTQGLVAQISTAAAAAEQRLTTQKEIIRTELVTQAEAQEQSVRSQVEAMVATLRGAFAAERARLESSVNAAREQIASGLAARQAEAIASGEDAKAQLTELFATRRAEMETTIQDNIAASEQMRTHYATMIHERTSQQAAEARRRGETKAASYPRDERGAVQAQAARGVAAATASEMEKREPEAVAAIEEVVAEIPEQFAEQGAQALVGFDDHLPELLQQVDEQVEEVNDALVESAEIANEQLDSMAEQLLAQIDALEEASIARAEAVGPQADAQTQNTLESSLAEIDTATTDSITQINQVKEDATKALLEAESSDPAAAQQFTDEVIAYINGIADTASEGLQQGGDVPGSGFEAVQEAVNESLQSVEQQVLDDLSTLREESDSALSGLIDELDLSFAESIEALEDGFAETLSEVDSQLGETVQKLKDDFANTLQEAENKIVEAVDEGVAKNDEALTQLGPSMEEAADDAAWDYDHPILSTLRDIGAFILGALAAIVVLILAIVAIILLFKAAVALLVIAGLSAAVAEAIVAIAGLALLAYAVYEAYQARVRAGASGGWGTFGMALLDMTGLTTIYRSFTQPGLTPFQRGWMFGEGLVQLVSTLLMVRGAWRFIRSGGLKTAWQALWRGAGALARGAGRLLRGAARGIGRGLRAAGRGLSSLGRGIARGWRGLGRWIRRLRRGSKPPPNRRVGCFVAGTLVQTAGGCKVIEDLVPGDEVVSLDVISGDQQRQKVARTFVRTVPVVIEIGLSGEVITCSPEHPFWVKDRGWRKAGALATGTELVRLDGEDASVQAIERREGTFDVFNIEVDGSHTYCVSDLGILVHNKAMRIGPNIEPISDGFAARHPVTDQLLGVGYFRDGYIEFAIETKGTNIRGGDVFNGIYDAFISSGYRVRGVRGLWYAQDNLASFNAQIRAGLTPEAAAFETFTGKMASRLGYNRVRIDYPNSPRNPDGTFVKAELWFE
ncbi:MAG TPA: polymorphic toxin-type HINT domain-containing protein [Pyrinomonadaceae bacterium]|nr:polymorphic toxin-type HINT domain-containing protein [Pyrinomonadaceae bacterium]